MSKTIMSLWEYVNFFDTELTNKFRQNNNYYSKIPKKIISSKNFLNLYKNEEIDQYFLKKLYMEYYIYIMN